MGLGSIADLLGAATTTISSIVALYLGLRKDSLNINCLINYDVNIRRWVVSISNAGTTPMLIRGVIYHDGKKSRMDCGIEARKPLDATCPGGEFEIPIDNYSAASIKCYIKWKELISGRNIKLQFLKKGNKQILYKVYWGIHHHRIIYKKLDEKSINIISMENFMKSVNKW